MPFYAWSRQNIFFQRGWYRFFLRHFQDETNAEHVFKKTFMSNGHFSFLFGKLTRTWYVINMKFMKKKRIEIKFKRQRPSHTWFVEKIHVRVQE